MATKKKQSTWAIVLTILLSIGAWYIKGQEDKKREESGSGGPVPSANVASETKDKSPKPAGQAQSKTQPKSEMPKRVSQDRALPKSVSSAFTKVKFGNQEFDVLKGCSLVKHRHNDGDSFHVKHGGKKTEFRLYFVDTAESQFKKYRDGNDNGKRIREQGAYFGGLDMQVTTEMGKVAKSFVKDLLSKQKFTVVTKWEDVYTPERKYCYVIVKWEGKDVYLHELLVAKGLVRIKTRGAALPDNTNYHAHKRKLQQLEKKARAAKIGAWGM